MLRGDELLDESYDALLWFFDARKEDILRASLPSTLGRTCVRGSFWFRFSSTHGVLLMTTTLLRGDNRDGDDDDNGSADTDDLLAPRHRNIVLTRDFISTLLLQPRIDPVHVWTAVRRCCSDRVERDAIGIAQHLNVAVVYSTFTRRLKVHGAVQQASHPSS
jgi:hypothetical protein